MKPKAVLPRHLIAATVIALLLILFSCAGDGWPPFESGVLPPALDPVVEVFAPEVDSPVLSGELAGEGAFVPDEVGAHSASLRELDGEAGTRLESTEGVAVSIDPAGSEGAGVAQGTGVGANGGASPVHGPLLALSLNGPDGEGSGAILEQVAAWLGTWTPPPSLAEAPSSGRGAAAAAIPDGHVHGHRPPLSGPLHGGSGSLLTLPADDSLQGAVPSGPLERGTRAIPEPPLLLLLLTGLCGLIGLRGRAWPVGQRLASAMFRTSCRNGSSFRR